MNGREVFGRRDVVIDERHSIGHRECRSRRLRADREVVEQQVVGMTRVDQFAIVARQRLEDAIRRFDEDLRHVAGLAQDALDPQHFVTDGVAIGQGRQNLMDRRRPDRYHALLG